MSPFSYRLGEIRKSVVAGLVLGLAVLGLLWVHDPSFDQAVIVLAGEVFAVVGVFLAKNHTIDDVSKALSQLQGAVVSVVGYFVVINPTTLEKMSVLVAAAVSAYAVFKTTNYRRTA